MSKLSDAIEPISGFKPTISWPDPTDEMIASPEFEAVWQAIKTWDINSPLAYEGYCMATGNHVRHILDALLRTHETGASGAERMLLLSQENAVCVGGRWDGWLFRRHPDGHWVSIRKLDAEDPNEAFHRALPTDGE